MKTLIVRLPEPLAAEIEMEAEDRGISKSEVVRERLQRTEKPKKGLPPELADIVGSVDVLPSDLSSNAKNYLRQGYGRKRSR
jgi:hypothetical protein